jgi:shikimate dehydrogenase
LKLYGLIGYPLGHSFSASYFADKFSREGIDAEYRNFPLEDIRSFEELVKQESGLKGLNVTVPYKQKIIPYLQSLSEQAKEVGAVNTISFIRSRGELKLAGDNTDVIGFRRSLEENLDSRHQAALVLGSGGSSKAVCKVLEKMGMEYALVSRKRGEDRISYADLDEDMMQRFPVIINTTPLGMYPQVDNCPDIPYENLGPGHLLFDLIYNPSLTRFLERGKKQGALYVNGYDMLVYQAEASWKIWNNI